MPQKSKLSLRIFFFWISATCFAFAVAQVAAGQERTVREIQSEIIQHRESVDALYVEFTVTREESESLKDDEVLKHLGKDTIQTTAFSGEKRYCDSWGTAFNSEMRPTRYLAVFDGERMYKRENKILDISEAKSSLAEMCVFLNVMSWPLSGDDFAWIEQDGELTNFLPVMLDSQWQIDSGEDDKQVHLSEPEHGRKLVLDSSKNYAVIRMEIPAERSGAGFGKSVRNFSDYRLVNGIWLPFEIDVQTEVYRFQTQEVGGTISTKLKVADIRVNEDVPQAIFHINPRPGEFVHNRITGEAYRSTEKAESIESVVASLQQRQAASPHQKYWTSSGFLFAGFALAGLLGGWILGYWRKK